MRRFLFFLLISILVLALAGATYVYVGYQEFLQEPLTIRGSEQVLEMPPGTSFHGLVNNLVKQRLTRDTWHWRVLGRFSEQAHRLQAGEYLLQRGTTPAELIDLMASGKVRLHSLTVIEGWTFRRMLAELHNHPALKVKTGDWEDAEIMAALDRADQHPEGRFLPETYHFPKGTSDLEFLQQAAMAMDQVLEQEWQGRATGLPLQSPYEALILASIIEKETGQDGERAEIAGVFVRRLQKSMRLQTDPTVIYGMGAAYTGNIRRTDLRTDTPYNTYTRDGLPPTPIALPGAAAIQAALNPADGTALYFVSRGDGTHVFSDTLQQHNAAVDRYQRGLR